MLVQSSGHLELQCQQPCQTVKNPTQHEQQANMTIVKKEEFGSVLYIENSTFPTVGCQVLQDDEGCRLHGGIKM